MIPRHIELQQGEEALLTIRRHWFILAFEGVLDVALFFIVSVVVIGFDLVALHKGWSFVGTIVSIGFLFLVLWVFYYGCTFLKHGPITSWMFGS